MKAAFVLIKLLEGKEKKNQIYFLLEEENKTTHLHVLWVWWSCQTTSKLSPGLTSTISLTPRALKSRWTPQLGGTE